MGGVHALGISILLLETCPQGSCLGSVDPPPPWPGATSSGHGALTGSQVPKRKLWLGHGDRELRLPRAMCHVLPISYHQGQNLPREAIFIVSGTQGHMSP